MSVPQDSHRRLSQLLRGVEAHLSLVNDPLIEHITDHSREVKPGSLFVAVKGYSTDGHRFIPQAVERGAVAVIHQYGEVPAGVVSVKVKDPRKTLSVVAKNFYGLSNNDLKLIGVTGTNGKTTVVNMIAHVLDGLGVTTAFLGTVGHCIAGERIEARHTTPSALELWRLLAMAKEKGCEVVAMEVSSHALEMDRVWGMEFDGSVFTNLTQDHLDFHQSMEAYFEAKSKLFTQLTKGISLVNLDDGYGRRLLGMLPNALSYGLKEGHYSARVVEMGAGGMVLEISHNGETHPMHSNLVGLHNAYNILAAAGVVHQCGFASLDRIIALLEGFQGVKGRLERVDTKGLGFSVFIDYAHTPHALESVIKALIPVTERELWVVFGCGGDRDRGKRPKMGAIAAFLAHRVVITSDNPRSEDPMTIIEDILRGIENSKKVVVEPDRERAIEYALTHAQQGDVVLIAGKGHETYQIFADRTIHFDDAEAARRVIGKL